MDESKTNPELASAATAGLHPVGVAGFSLVCLNMLMMGSDSSLGKWPPFWLGFACLVLINFHVHRQHRLSLLAGSRCRGPQRQPGAAAGEPRGARQSAKDVGRVLEVSLLSLDSQRWAELRHAYGAASDTPALLRQLSSLPASGGDAEPWFTIWSSLAHQGDVYSASFAAVPHVVAALATAPGKADCSYFQFPAWVEVCRRQKHVPIPADLEPAYTAALARLPRLVAEAATEPWAPELLSCALAAIAAAKGSASVAEAVLELSPEVADEFLGWLHDR